MPVAFRISTLGDSTRRYFVRNFASHVAITWPSRETKKKTKNMENETTEAACENTAAAAASAAAAFACSPLDVVSYSCCDALDRRGNSQ